MHRFEQSLVTVFGGSGFVGTQLVQALSRAGYRIRVAVRRPDLAGHLKTLGDVGQIIPIQANVRDMASVKRAVDGASIVINLVGVGFERGLQSFANVHAVGGRNIAEAARDAGAKALVHMSALGVDKNPDSLYARSKFEGEAAVLAAFPQAVIIRPSILFGQDDGFFNLMGSLARMSPVMPLIGGDTLFQPAFVGDVAQAFLLAAEGKVKGGVAYEIGGPEVETHRQLLQRILRETHRSNPLIAIPSGIAKLMALPFSILPFPPLLTADQVDLLAVDNIVSPEAITEKRTIAAFGIVPNSMDTILPTYMWRFRKNGQFDKAPTGGTIG